MCSSSQTQAYRQARISNNLVMESIAVIVQDGQNNGLREYSRACLHSYCSTDSTGLTHERIRQHK